MTRNKKFLAKLAAQLGKPYRYGAETRLSDPDPPAFDCSELVQWALYQAGVRSISVGRKTTSIQSFDGSANQYRCSRHISLAAGRKNRGALLFGVREGVVRHVAVSMGDGTTIEARGRKYGVCRANVGTRFKYATKVDELFEEV
jgi:cell wall-associated NlpC family hydrolase